MSITFDSGLFCGNTNQFSYVPTEGDWVVADTVLPRMKKLNIYGTLEIDDQPDPATGRVREFVLEATYIYIRGGRLLAGWEDSPFTGKLDILLNGNHHTPNFPREDGPNIGSKVIGRLCSQIGYKVIGRLCSQICSKLIGRLCSHIGSKVIGRLCSHIGPKVIGRLCSHIGSRVIGML